MRPIKLVKLTFYKAYSIIITIAFIHSENLNQKSHLLNVVGLTCLLAFNDETRGISP